MYKPYAFVEGLPEKASRHGAESELMVSQCGIQLGIGLEHFGGAFGMAGVAGELIGYTLVPQFVIARSALAIMAEMLLLKSGASAIPSFISVSSSELKSRQGCPLPANDGIDSERAVAIPVM